MQNMKTIKSCMLTIGLENENMVPSLLMDTGDLGGRDHD